MTLASIPRLPSTRPASPARILVAEDDDELREVVLEALALDGHVSEGVSDGKRMVEALRLAWVTGRQFDLVITDVRMPGLSGLEAIASSGYRPAAGFLVLTAFPSEETLQDASRAGAAGVLAKPFDLDDLRLAASLLLGRIPAFR